MVSIELYDHECGTTNIFKGVQTINDRLILSRLAKITQWEDPTFNIKPTKITKFLFLVEKALLDVVGLPSTFG